MISQKLPASPAIWRLWSDGARLIPLILTGRDITADIGREDTPSAPISSSQVFTGSHSQAGPNRCMEVIANPTDRKELAFIDPFALSHAYLYGAYPKLLATQQRDEVRH